MRSAESVHLDTRKSFAPVISELSSDLPVTIVSPDAGGVKRAQLLREMLEAVDKKTVGFAFVEKRRSRGIVTGDLFAGDVEGTASFILDDIISSGGTMLRAAQACRQRGAKAVFALATHGLFGPGAEALFEGETIDFVMVTDSVASAARYKSDNHIDRLRIVSIAPLLAGHVRSPSSATRIR